MSVQLAKIALELVKSAPTVGANAEAVVAVKQWLAKVISGELIVAEKPQ